MTIRTEEHERDSLGLNGAGPKGMHGSRACMMTPLPLAPVKAQIGGER